MSRFGKLVYDDATTGKLVYDDYSGKLVYADTLLLEYTTDITPTDADLHYLKESSELFEANAIPSMRVDAWNIGIATPDIKHYLVNVGLLWYAQCHIIGFILTPIDAPALDYRDANNAKLTKVTFTIKDYVNTGGGAMYVGYRTDAISNDWSWVTGATGKVAITGDGEYELPINEVVTSNRLWLMAWQEDAVATGDQFSIDLSQPIRLYGEPA